MNKKRWNRIVFLAPVMLFIAGAAIFLYPAISNYIAEKKQWNVIKTYDAKMSDKSEQEIEKEWKAANLYNENLIGKPVHDPFVVDSGFVLPDNYQEVLNIGKDGVMCYLSIPKVNIHIPVYHGTDEKVLQNGAGHLEMTSLPIGGEGNHSMLCAHRGLPSAELFSRLDELKKGDLFYIHVLNKIHTYEIDQIKTIKPEDMKIHYESNQDLITLMTCTPYGVNTHRLLVRGKRVFDHNEKKQETVIENDWRSWYIYGIVSVVGILIVKKGYQRYEKKKEYK